MPHVCMRRLRAHARMYYAKKRKKLLTLCMWRGAEAFDSSAHAQPALIISQCLQWKRNPRVLWCFFCSSDIVFARHSASYIVFYYRYGCCLPRYTTVCYFPSSFQKKCIEISEMHPYRHLHRLWNTCGRQCSYFLSHHGCLTSPALPSRWVFSSVRPCGHSRWCCWVCYLLHLNSQHALLYETGWDASRQEVVEKLV